MTLNLCMLLVAVLPYVIAEIEFQLQPQSTAVVIGQGAVLHCLGVDTDGGGHLSVVWSMDGGAVAAKTSVFQNNSLYVPNVQQSDLGEYTCTLRVGGDLSSERTSREATLLEAFIKDFVIDPQPPATAVHVNGTAQFHCVSGKSAPPPQLYWEKDGALFTEGAQHIAVFGSIEGDGSIGQLTSLLEFRVTKSHEGWYRCVARNPLTGEERRSKESNLTVSYEPVAPYIPRGADLQSFMYLAGGVPYSLHCPIQGWPQPTLTWYKNRHIAKATTGMHLYANGTLAFSTVDGSTEGLYYCRGSYGQNSIMSSTLNISVAVLDAEFKQEPQDVEAMAGTATTIHCQPPRSVPQSSVTWYKDGTEFQQRSGVYAATVLPSGDLYFSYVQKADEGQYMCVAVNPHAIPQTRASNPAVLTVKGRPLFVLPPVPTEVIKNHLLHMTCSVEADPPAQVDWFRNQVKIVANDRTQFRDSNQELYITNVDKLNEGIYYCTARNIHGNAKSAEVFVKVLVPPEIMQTVPHLVRAEGSYTQLQCGVYGDPFPAVTWAQDGQPVQYNNRRVLQGTQLTITSVTTADQGNYTCTATNKAGSKQSTGSLRIQVPPTFTSYPVDLAVNKSDRLVIPCQVSGVPEPVISWSFNGHAQLPNGVSLSADKMALTIASVDEVHDGTFTCMADNGVGTRRHSGTIFVQVQPTISHIEGRTIVGRGKDLTLTCVAVGTPAPSYTWYHRGTLLAPVSNNRILFPSVNSVVVKYVTQNDSGVYSCQTQNAAGRSTYSVHVYIRDPPRPPVLQSAVPVSPNSVNLTWVPVQQDTNNDVSFFVVQYREKVKTDYITFHHKVSAPAVSYELFGLSAGTEYFVRVLAENEIGTGDPSNSLLVKTFETAPSEPRNFYITSIQANSISLSWEIPSTKSGQIKYYQVHYKPANGTEAEYTVDEIGEPQPATHTYTITGLRPYTWYAVRVRAATVEGGVKLWGNFTALLHGQTLQAVPSAPVTGLRALAISSTAIQVSWNPIGKEDRNGPIRHYRITYAEVNTVATFNLTTTETSATIATNLLPWRSYSISIIAYNAIGASPKSAAVEVRTLPSAPGGSPRQVSLTALSSTSIQVMWQPVEHSKQNGEISGYKLYVVTQNTSETRVITVTGKDTLSANISNLQVWTTYSVSVSAYTHGVTPEEGPVSAAYTIRTKEGRPGPVEGLTATAGSYMVELSWQPPPEPRGIISQYVITYYGIPITTTTTTTTTTATTTTTTTASSTTAFNTTDGNETISDNGMNISLTVSTTESQRLLQKRDVEQLNTSVSISTPNTSITISHLQANTRYTFSVLAQTGGGLGQTAAEVTVETLPPTPTPTIPTSAPPTTPPSTTTTQLQRDTLPTPAPLLDPRYLPYVIGGAVAVFILIVVVVILIACCCRRKRRRKDSGSRYFIPPSTARNMDMQLEVHSPERPGNMNGQTRPQHMLWEDSSDTDHTPDPYRLRSSHTFQQPSSSGTLSTTEQESSVLYAAPRGRMKRYTSPQRRSGLDTIHDQTPSLSNGSHVSGIVNPSYNLDIENNLDRSGAGVTMKGKDVSAGPLNGGPRPQGEYTTKKKNRKMRSDSAAAIAAERNRRTTLLAENDTESLINNESVVVYDERTAL